MSEKQWEVVYKGMKGREEKTEVSIKLEDAGRYSFHTRIFVGNRLGDSDSVLIDAVLAMVQAELDPTSAIVQTQEQLKDTEKRLALTEELGKVAQQNGKLTHIMVLNSVMSKNIAYGTIYKQLVELIPLGVTGQLYHADELFTIEDPNHVEVDGEGKRVLVQASKDFTYNGEPVSDFVTGGRLELSGAGVAWKYEGKE